MQITLSKSRNIAGNTPSTTTILISAPLDSSVQMAPIISTFEYAAHTKGCREEAETTGYNGLHTGLVGLPERPLVYPVPLASASSDTVLVIRIA